MLLTNRLGLPEPIFAALRNDDYSRGDAWRSVTQLIDPPRRVLLYERHSGEFTEDVSDRLWLLMGKAVHSILEGAGATGIREQRLFMAVAGKKISGATDYLHLESETLTDYKVTSVYTVKRGDRFKKWEEQTNLYRLLCAENGYPTISKLQAAVICRDWRPGEAKRESGYPQTPFVLVPLKVWSLEEARGFLHDQVELHLHAETALPHCTAVERWKKPDAFALMKQGRKSAVLLYSVRGEAEAGARRAGSGHSIEFRPGEPTRCVGFCAAKEVCMRLNDGQWSEAERMTYGVSA